MVVRAWCLWYYGDGGSRALASSHHMMLTIYLQQLYSCAEVVCVHSRSTLGLHAQPSPPPHSTSAGVSGKKKSTTCV
jgi:hypothetical protein